MGLIKSAINFTKDNMVQSIKDAAFKEYVTCPEVGNDVIIQRGTFMYGTASQGSTSGVLSNGSGVVVPQGMAMMIVDNGKVAEFSAEPGLYTYDSSSEPSFYTGGNIFTRAGDILKKGLTRMTFGGQAAKDQRVYYINIKNMPAIPFGSSQSEPIYDPIYGSVEITYNGEFNIKVDDPITLVDNVLGANPKDTLTFDDIFTSESGMAGNILKTKFSEKVSGAISDLITETGVPFNRIQSHKSEISDKMNTVLNDDWYEKYGIIVTDVAIRINASEESREQIREIDKARGMVNVDAERVSKMSKAYGEDPNAAITAATGEAMLNASKNENGVVTPFIATNMAQNYGSNAINSVNQANVGVVAGGEGKYCPNCGKPANGNFCGNCGNKMN